MGIETGTAVLIGGALAGAGAIASAASTPDPPNIPPPPPPASYEQYDENGNLLTQQVWDAKRNTYVTKFDPEPEKYKGGTMPPPDPGFVYNYAGTRPERRVPIQQQANTEWTNSSDYAPSHINLPQQQDSQGWVNLPPQTYSGTNPVPISQQPETDEEYQQRLNQWQSKRDQATAMWHEQYPSTPTEEWTAWNKRKTERAVAKAKEAEGNKIRMEIRSKILANINQTPEDRVKAYDEYAKTFSDVMHTDVDKRYTDRKNAIAEDMNARGLFGARAYVDSMTELNKDKSNIDTDIAQKAALAKEQLRQTDQDSYLRTLAQLDAGTKEDALIALERVNAASRGANAGTAAIMAGYNADSNNILKRWDIEAQNNRVNTKYYGDTASGLAYLYGITKNTNKGGSPVGGGNQGGFSDIGFA